RVAEISRTASQLELTRAGARAEIENAVLRQIGADGVVVAATVAACRPALVINAPGTASPPAASAEAGRACTEAEASPVTLCATIPGSAKVTELELFSRPADSDGSWSANRFVPGQESGQARFAEKYSQSTPEGGTQQVCQAFTHWSADRARLVRMIGRGLWTPDEPREADIAWRMSRQTDHTLPQLAGTPFLEKPPLSYWMSGAAIWLFGDSAAAARVPNLLYAAITALAVGALALAMQTDAPSALLAALIAASALTAFRASSWLAPDACLLAGSALALLGAWRGYRASAG